MFGYRLVTANEVYISFFVFCKFCLRVLREIKNNRSRTSATSYIKCAAYSPCHFLGTSYLISPFRYWLRNINYITFLKGIGSQSTHSYLSGNNYHWSAVHHGIGDARYGICGTRSARCYSHTNFSAYAGIPFGSMRGSLLMTHKNMIYLLSLIIVKLVIHRHYGSAGITKHRSYSFVY